MIIIIIIIIIIIMIMIMIMIIMVIIIIIIIAYETIKDNFPPLIAKCRKASCFSLIIRNWNLIG